MAQTMPKSKVRLGDYLTLLTDYHANGSYEKLRDNVTLSDDPDYAVMIRTTNFEKDDFVKDLKYISKNAYVFLKKSRVEPGDILMNKIADPGSTYLMPNLNRPVSLAMNLFLLKTDTSKLDQTYAYYWLKANESYVKSFACGAATATITKKAVRELELDLPPLPIQQRISAILFAYEELIKNCQRRIKILESMARALYREWFVHFRFPGHENHPRVASPLGEIPQGWEVKKLKDVCRLTMGQSPKSEFYNEVGDGMPFHQGVTNFGDRFPTDRLFCTAEGRIAEAGDILFSVRAPVGRMNIADKKIILGRGLSAIRYDEGSQAFLWEQLRNRFTKDDMMGNGAIFASVTKDDLQGIELVCPPSSVVDAATKHFEPLHSQIAVVSQKIQNLRRTRDLLLPRLLSGQVSLDETIAMN